MSLKVVLTLVVSFIIVVFSLFNYDVVTISLLGYKKVSLPISVLIFFVFLFGAAYAAVLSFQLQIDQAMTIRKLKKKVQDLKAGALPQEQDVAPDTTPRTMTVVKPPVSGTKSRLPVAPNKAIAVAKETAKDKAPAPEILENEDEEDEGGLPSKLREIALRRIQNG